MNFRTQVELPEKEVEIRHSEQIMLFGSCFAENIGNLLVKNKFRCDVNANDTLNGTTDGSLNYVGSDITEINLNE